MDSIMGIEKEDAEKYPDVNEVYPYDLMKIKGTYQ